MQSATLQIGEDTPSRIGLNFGQGIHWVDCLYHKSNLVLRPEIELNLASPQGNYYIFAHLFHPLLLTPIQVEKPIIDAQLYLMKEIRII